MSPKNSIDALIDLLCCYYVFNIKYSPEVKPALLFLQSQLLGIEDGETKRSKILGIFMKRFKSYQTEAIDGNDQHEEGGDQRDEEDE